MKQGAWAAFLGAFFLVGSVVWLPIGASARQSLAEQTAAAGIVGQQAKQAAPNGVGAVSRARTLQKQAAARQAEDPTDAPAAAAKPSQPQKEEVFDARSLGDAKTEKELNQAKGLKFGVRGVVEFALKPEGGGALVVKPDPSLKFPEDVRFMIQFAAEVPVKQGEQVAVIGRFAKLHMDSKAKKIIFMMEQGELVGPAPAPAAPTAAQAPAPPPESVFTAELGGYRLTGAAEIDLGTAVFLSPEGKPAFVRVGEKLNGSVKVLAVDGSRVTLQASGKPFDVVVW